MQEVACWLPATNNFNGLASSLNHSERRRLARALQSPHILSVKRHAEAAVASVRKRPSAIRIASLPHILITKTNRSLAETMFKKVITQLRALHIPYMQGPTSASLLNAFWKHKTSRSTCRIAVTQGVNMPVPINVPRGIKACDSDLQFVIGQDLDGRWIAMDFGRREGGVFVSREAAAKFAASESGQRPETIPCSREPLTLWN